MTKTRLVIMGISLLACILGIALYVLGFGPWVLGISAIVAAVAGWPIWKKTFE